MPDSTTEHRQGDDLNREQLGTVIAPSGILVVLDMGLLNLWCHDRPPRMPEGILSDEMTASVNAGVDLRIDGPDAERAGRTFDRQWHPRYLYDLPAHGNDRIQESFDRLMRERELDARLAALPDRIPHRRRVDLALEHGGGAGELQFFGIMGIAVGHVPRGGPLPVYGTRMPEDGPDAGRWRRIWVECRPDLAVARSEAVGIVAVDKARLIIADADALGAWQHEEPLDGRADVVFWGRDAATLAAEVDADNLGENDWGWVDLPVAEAAERCMRVERLRDERGSKLAVDFRPHSHHYAVMRQVRGSVTESGTQELSGASVCGFMTSWGDGIFPVERDLDAGGHLVRLRIELGCDAIVDRQRRFDERWSGEFARNAVASERVFEDGQCVRFLYREEPDNGQDSGWRVFAGGEDQVYCEDPGNIRIVPLRELIDGDPSLEALFRSPLGSVFEREHQGDEFRVVSDYDPG